MKKLVSFILLLALLVFSLSACGNTEQQTESIFSKFDKILADNSERGL